MPKLQFKKKYLQIALNNTLSEAKAVIKQLPISDRIILEVGTPMIKRYGEKAIRNVKLWYTAHIMGKHLKTNPAVSKLFQVNVSPYIVADLKMMDRGETEVDIAVRGGADAAVALGHAPIESLNSFIEKCEKEGIDSMIDMMNVNYPLSVLRQLKKIPNVVILHRGVDEEKYNKEKQLPLYEIRRIKANYNILISVAGGDTIKEIQSAIFNDADIVVVWKSFYQKTDNTAKLAQDFLKEIK